MFHSSSKKAITSSSREGSRKGGTKVREEELQGDRLKQSHGLGRAAGQGGGMMTQEKI